MMMVKIEDGIYINLENIIALREIDIKEREEFLRQWALESDCLPDDKTEILLSSGAIVETKTSIEDILKMMGYTFNE